MSKISRVSKFIKALLLIIALLQISVYVVLFLFANSSSESSEMWFHYFGMSSGFAVDFSGSWQGIAEALAAENFNPSLLLGIAEAVPYLLIYFFLYKLFGLYQQGIIFTMQNIQYIKNVAIVLLAWIGLNIFYPVLLILVLRFSGASNSLPIIINFGSTELGYLLSGLVIYVVAWVMSEALQLQQEQELVI
jgi:DUF2975 family protein